MTKARTAFLLPLLFPVLFSCKSPTKSSSRNDDPGETFSETLSIDDFTLKNGFRLSFDAIREAVEKDGNWNMDCNRISVHCQSDDVTLGLLSTLV